MKQKIKRLLCCIMAMMCTGTAVTLSGTMHFPNLSITAEAEELYIEPPLMTDILVVDDIVYEINAMGDQDYISMISCLKSVQSFEIPSEIENLLVTHLVDAFSSCTSLTSVTIPDSITSIGKNAFTGTAILEGQTADIKYVDKWLVTCEDTEFVELAAGTVGIANSVFEKHTALRTITLPDSMISIGVNAFYNCTNLKNITFPEGMVNIEENAFYNCTSLENITLSDHVAYIGKSTFCNCICLKNIVIPNGVTHIEEKTFYNCISLENITIPDSVRKIGTYAFYNTPVLSASEQSDNVKYVDKMMRSSPVAT